MFSRLFLLPRTASQQGSSHRVHIYIPYFSSRWEGGSDYFISTACSFLLVADIKIEPAARSSRRMWANAPRWDGRCRVGVFGVPWRLTFLSFVSAYVPTANILRCSSSAGLAFSLGGNTLIPLTGFVVRKSSRSHKDEERCSTECLEHPSWAHEGLRIPFREIALRLGESAGNANPLRSIVWILGQGPCAQGVEVYP